MSLENLTKEEYEKLLEHIDFSDIPEITDFPIFIRKDGEIHKMSMLI